MNNLSQAHLWNRMNLALKQIKEQPKTPFIPKYIVRKAEVVQFNKPILKVG